MNVEVIQKIKYEADEKIGERKGSAQKEQKNVITIRQTGSVVRV